MVTKGEDMKPNYINMAINLAILVLLIHIAIQVNDIHTETVNDCPTCMIPLGKQAE